MSSSNTEVTVINEDGETTKYLEGAGFYIDEGILYITNEQGHVIGAVRSWDRVALTDAPDTHTSILGRTCRCGTEHWRNT